MPTRWSLVRVIDGTRSSLRLFFFAVLMLCAVPARGQRVTNPQLYGSALRGDSLGNAPLTPGSYGGQSVSFRFRASLSGQAESVAYYNKNTGSGYTAGTGGVVVLELRTDDGTGNHWPSSTVLASATIQSPLSVEAYATYALDKKAALSAGQLYHLVITNTASNPQSNYTSVNCLHNFREQPDVNMDVGIKDEDLAVLVKDVLSDTTWTQHYQRTPIFNVFFDNGTALGQGYFSAISGHDHSMSATDWIRETFTVTGPSMTVSSVALRAKRDAGDLNIRLERKDGTLIAEGVCPGASLVPDETKLYHMGWCTYTFPSSLVLEQGMGYNLIFYSQNGSFLTFGLLKGQRYSWNASTHFSDGWAQFSTDGGQTWKDYLYGGNPIKDVDLQFYLAQSSTTPPHDGGVAADLGQRCGNNVVDPGETCDPPSSCPASCDDSIGCTIDALTGSADQCDVVCSYTTIETCVPGDNCCPASCDAQSDSDCSASCGNGVVDPGETCDPPSNCPASCDDQQACTADDLIGGAHNCNAVCQHIAITSCLNSDGCCPPSCTAKNDDDCLASLTDGGQGGPGSDGSAANAEHERDDGCGCITISGVDQHLGGLLLLFGLLAFVRRARRRVHT